MERGLVGAGETLNKIAWGGASLAPVKLLIICIGRSLAGAEENLNKTALEEGRRESEQNFVWQDLDGARETLNKTALDGGRGNS